MSAVTSFTVRLGLFVSSYFPAFLIIAILFYRRDWRVALLAVFAGVAGCLALWLTLRHLRSLVPNALEVKSCRRQDTEAMTYVVSYVVPFLFGILESPESMVAFLVFFVWIGILYANSNMIHINPMLNLFRYQICQIETDQKRTLTLIARRDVHPGDTISAVAAGGGVYLRVGP